MNQLPQIIKTITRIIVESAHPEKIILFGSCARGEQNPDSDIDILVIKKTDQPRYKRAQEIKRNLRGIKQPLDLLVYTPEEIEKWKDVASSLSWTALHEGIVLYG